MRVHQMPLVPDRLPLERPQPKPPDGSRLRDAFADIVAMRVDPREKDSRKPPQRGRQQPTQPEDETAEPAVQTGTTRIDLLT